MRFVVEQPAAAQQVTQSPPAPAPEIADAAVQRAEQIAFLALASELARERRVLVVDGGESALAGIAAHLDSANFSELPAKAGEDYELVVVDLIGSEPALEGTAALLADVIAGENGIALVRVPNRPELAHVTEQLAAVFAKQLNLRQHNWVSSALFDDALFSTDDPSRAAPAAVRKLAGAASEEALYNVVIATNGALPKLRPQLALTRSPQLTAVLEDLEQARRRAEHDRASYEQRIAELDARVLELGAELAWYEEHQLAIRETVENRPLAAAVLSWWVLFRTNIGKLRRALGS